MLAVLVILATSDLKPAPSVLDDTPPAPELEGAPRLVIDLYPLAMSAPLAAGAAIEALMVYVPVSVTWVLSDSAALYAELAGAFVVPHRGTIGGTVSVSVGALFSFGPAALQGFFVCPKLGFQLSNANTQLGTEKMNGPIDFGPAWSRAFLGGADVGYQWTWGKRHIAVMLGASLGYEYDNNGPFLDPLGLQRGTTFGRRPVERNQGFAYAVNANLFRIGFGW